MCQPVRCDRCLKITWAGCGDHAEAVMSQVPVAQRCECTPDAVR